MFDVQSLVVLEEIKRLKYRYMRALDTQDWDLMESLFVEDAVVWFGNGRYSAKGRDEILKIYRALLTPSFVSSHIAVHPEIELTGENTATAVWRFEDTVHFTAPNPAAKGADIKGGEEMQGAGYYTDEYVRVGGAWKIRSTGYVRIYERIEARGQRDMVLHVEPDRGVKR